MKNLYVVDLTQDKSKINPYISNTLLNEIENNLKNKSKTLLYINKRGAFNMVICKDCNNIEKCENCDLSMNAHSQSKKLVCHHCMHSKDYILNCSKCGSTNIEYVWVWTQQIQDILQKYFPNSKIFRMDTDTLKNKKEKLEALDNIEYSDIVIWTKMITTWFNFKNISTIWVILLEQELNIPKYNTEETVYSNIKQLIWRWWRVGQETNIIIQTFVPSNSLINNIVNLNYKDFLKITLEERKLFNYPPFTKMVHLNYRDKDKQKSYLFAKELFEKLKKINNDDKNQIILVENTKKRDQNFISTIIIKSANPNILLDKIKTDIFRNSWLSVVFE